MSQMLKCNLKVKISNGEVLVRSSNLWQEFSQPLTHMLPSVFTKIACSWISIHTGRDQKLECAVFYAKANSQQIV